MKICAAQTKPVRGNIKKNIEQHLVFIERAIAGNAAIIIFPELSLTGYEPALARDLAIDKNDSRLDTFQHKSDAGNIVIAAGAPVKVVAGVQIGMLIFQPGKMRQSYSKKFLHNDEKPFFVPGQGGSTINIDNNIMAFAICYEISVPEHAVNASESGAAIYLASAAKTTAGMEKANLSLSAIATQYAMRTMICNCTGHCDNFESAGGSAAWDDKGNLLGRLDDTKEGLLFFDTSTYRIAADVNFM
jgi:predicted amidohydrolase